MRCALVSFLCCLPRSYAASGLVVDALLFDKRPDAKSLPALSGAYRPLIDGSFVKRAGSVHLKRSGSQWCFSYGAWSLLCSQVALLENVKTWVYYPPSCQCKPHNFLATTHPKPGARCFCKRDRPTQHPRWIHGISIWKQRLKTTFKALNTTKAVAASCPAGTEVTRKPRKVVLAFTVNDETGAILTQLHELYPVVDAFLWIECLTSVTGLPRSSTLERMRHKIAPYMDKVLEVTVTAPFTSEAMRQDALEKGKDVLLQNKGWLLIEKMYNSAGEVLSSGQIKSILPEGLAPDDSLIMADADEVLRREVVWQVKHCSIVLPVRFELKSFVYSFSHYEWQLTRSFFSWYQESKWAFVIGISVGMMTDFQITPHAARLARIQKWDFKDLGNRAQAYRSYLKFQETHLPHAGWHMHQFYGPRQVARKRAMAAHYKVNRRPLNLTSSIGQMMLYGRDSFQRDCIPVKGSRATSCKANLCEEPELSRSGEEQRINCVFKAQEPLEGLPHILRDDPSMLCLRKKTSLEQPCPPDVADLPGLDSFGSSSALSLASKGLFDSCRKTGEEMQGLHMAQLSNLRAKAERGRVKVLHIGANSLNDEELIWYQFLHGELLGKLDFVFVEANSEVIPALRRGSQFIVSSSTHHKSSIQILNFALCSGREAQVLHSISPRLHEDFPNYRIAKQHVSKVSSMNKSWVLHSIEKWATESEKQQMEQRGGLAAYIDSSLVPCYTPEALLAAAGFAAHTVDMFVIDTEGYDTEFLRLFLALPRFAPSVLQFEHVRQEVEALKLTENLAQRSYKVHCVGRDVLAIASLNASQHG